MLRSLTTGDRVLLILLLLAVISSYFAVNAILAAGSGVLVEVDNVVVYKASLSTESTFVISGVRGMLTISVADGAVSVLSSDCPNKICVRTGARSHSGEVIVCVPNRTIVRITGRSEGVRAVTG